ncbi:hypothetical protein E1193_10325 [Micromonospora sp. KC606]|uniref:hypothetical protein n=1 Tax=Micromonospora sp. KC606 TaxID=2530379 RepID=UPI00105020AA|nr:hypothetical protein [Micromonospora sp. KC606]TDC82948.1 hypothetical protein E1193_10325 [Micromonospora sp. KC606]
MAGRRWGGSTATAAGVAAGVGAAQLGFAYGLGIIDWAPVDTVRVEAAWFASLAWATWIAAVSTVLGAVCAQRLDERGSDEPPPGGVLRRATLAVAAAVGASLTVLLVAVPARVATAPHTSSPPAVAAGYAAGGVLLGLLAALWALSVRAAATNVIITVGWLWLLAVVSVVDGALAGRGLNTAQLGIWQISADRPGYWLRDYVYWPGVLLATGSALLIGALAARRAARLAPRGLGAAISGAAGPLLVAVAYLLAVPRLASVTPAQVSAHLVAPYAVLVGAAGSVLVAALAQRAVRRAAAGQQGSVFRQRADEPPLPPADDPTPVGGETTAAAPLPAVPAPRSAEPTDPAPLATTPIDPASDGAVPIGRRAPAAESPDAASGEGPGQPSGDPDKPTGPGAGPKTRPGHRTR